MSYIISSLPPIKCTVDGTRKWSAGDDWFYDIEEKSA